MPPNLRVGFWIRRYLPSEIAGTILSLVAAWLTLDFTDSLVAAAIAGTAAESIGFYGWHSVGTFANSGTAPLRRLGAGA